jgi:hypothetical protein
MESPVPLLAVWGSIMAGLAIAVAMDVVAGRALPRPRVAGSTLSSADESPGRGFLLAPDNARARERRCHSVSRRDRKFNERSACRAASRPGELSTAAPARERRSAGRPQAGRARATQRGSDRGCPSPSRDEGDWSAEEAVVREGPCGCGSCRHTRGQAACWSDGRRETEAVAAVVAEAVAVVAEEVAELAEGWRRSWRRRWRRRVPLRLTGAGRRRRWRDDLHDWAKTGAAATWAGRRCARPAPDAEPVGTASLGTALRPEFRPKPQGSPRRRMTCGINCEARRRRSRRGATGSPALRNGPFLPFRVPSPESIRPDAESPQALRPMLKGGRAVRPGTPPGASAQTRTPSGLLFDDGSQHRRRDGSSGLEAIPRQPAPQCLEIPTLAIARE